MTPRMMETPSTTSFLLEIFSTEIARDGGAALVTSLKDYSSLAPKRLNALLVDSIQKPKVLAFLEAYPCIFQVDRQATPHWVVLTCSDYVDWSSLAGISTEKKQNAASLQRAKLCDRVLYALRQRYAKNERRRRRQQKDQLAAAGDDDDDDPATTSTKLVNQHISNPHADDAGVNTAWLLRQCSWDFHEYLRAAGIYLKRIYPNNRISCDNTNRESVNYDVPFRQHDEHHVAIPMKQIVQPVGTRPWEDLVLEEFTSMLLHMKKHETDCLVVDAEQKQVWFQDKPNETSTTATNSSESILGTSKTYNLSYLRALDETLTELVDQDGATQVRLEVLLQRYDKLKRMLGGRDLWDLVQQTRNSSNGDTAGDAGSDGNYFDKLHIVKDGPDIILQSNNQNREGRMKVDSEGLFSVANGKWGTAMANSMVRCCQQVGWATSPNSNSGSESKTDITAIDLTASVGGMTLGLVKTRFFNQVIGVEIDPHRADLCRQNMTEHMSGECIGTVDIRTMDAMDAIPTLPPRSCLVIDPPWGGENYKKKHNNETKKHKNPGSTTTSCCDQPPELPPSSKQQLHMGPWMLEDILCKIYHCLRPCLVGLRLPVTFVVDDILKRLRTRLGIDEHCESRLPLVQTLTVRKLSVQLFVVLYFSTEEAA